MQRAIIAALCPCLAALAFTGCGGWNAEKAAEDGIFLLGNDAEPQDLDPHVVQGFTEHKILIALFEGLTTLDGETLAVEPGVAESWEISDDQRVYTFTLRDDAKWSNGDPVTAGDFVFAWKRILTPELGSEYSYMLHVIRSAKEYNEGALTDFEQVGVKALDPHTLEVTLNNPTPYFLSMQIHYTWFPLHRPTIEKFNAESTRGTAWTRAGSFVGNGPFKLAEWKPNQYIRAEKSEHYWNKDVVRLNGIVFFPIDNLQTEERNFRAGMLHKTGDVHISKIPVYREENPDLLYIHPWYGTYFYRFNTEKPPFDNPLVRKAFSMAIDRQKLIDNVLQGGEQPAHALTPPDPLGYAPPEAVAYNPEEAKRLLAEAGYPGGEGLPPVELLYNTSDNHKLIAEFIQRNWKETLGAEVMLHNEEWKVYLESMTNLNYQAARSAWIGDVHDPINFLECFLTDGGNNRTGWSNAEYDALVERARTETDEAARFDLYRQAETILMDEMPIAPIYVYTRKFLMRPEVKGFHANIMGHIPYTELYLEPVAK